MHLTVPIENFKMEAQKLIDENMEYRNVFEKETSREIHDLRNDVNKIDFSGVTESLEFETNIRTDEISKLDAKRKSENSSSPKQLHQIACSMRKSKN